MPSPIPADIVMSPSTLRIVWDDDGAIVTDFPARDLRIACRCAACVSETTGARLLDPASVPADIALRDASLSGNYGIAVDFSDGHRTGIYAWAYLLSLVDDDLRGRIERSVPSQ